MDGARQIKQETEHNINYQVLAEPFFQKYGQGWQEYCQDNKYHLIHEIFPL